MRYISKKGRTQLAAIRTSQDGWIALPAQQRDSKWLTLDDVDVGVAAAMDPVKPKMVNIHLFDARELRERFNRACTAHGKRPATKLRWGAASGCRCT